MKKLLLFGAAFTAMTFTAQAQDMDMSESMESKTRFGLEAGGTFNSFLNDYPENFVTGNQLKVGIYAGGLADIKISDRFSFQPALQYVMKGGQEENSIQIQNQPTAGDILKIEEKNKITLHYIQAPINFVYHAGDAMDNHFFVGAGPYIGALLGGDNKYKRKAEVISGGTNVNLPEVESTQDIEIGDDNTANFKRLDFGANLFLGYQLESGLFFKAGGSIGLASVVPENQVRLYNGALNNTDGFKSRNYNWFVGLGWMF